MAYFNVNIFGTTHYPGSTTPPNGSIRFNLHVLQVESDLTPTNFDMFIEFYAFPFNSLGVGTVVNALNNQQLLSDRYLVNQPQVIHIDQLVPNIGSPIYLANCSPTTIVEPGFPIPPCSPPQLTLPSCPSPSDYRLFSHPFQVKTKLLPGNSTFDTNWSDIKNSSGGNNILTEGNIYLLPIKIVIISDGCRYEKTDNVRIYNNYIIDNPDGTDRINGSPFCWRNPNYYPLGEFDKILVT